jgi:hypothetical protein
MEFVLGVLKILFPFAVALVVGLAAVYLFFYLRENKKDKIWTKDLKKLEEEVNIEKDKKLHKDLMVRDSFTNSIERLRDFLTAIYRRKQKTFSLTALDAILMVEIFPFNITKAKDGTYYIIDENEFLFFLKYLINENYKFMSDEKVLEIRDILTNKLLDWNPNEIVVDVKFVFDLIKNDNIPSGDIKDQRFIKLAPVLEEKVLFKVGEINEEKNENIDKNIEENNKQNQDFSIIKGKKQDYMIDLRTGIQYVINKNKNEDENKKENKEEKLEKLMENISILIASQPQQISNSIKEIVKELNLKNSEINTTELKEKLEKNILEKVNNVDEKTQETKQNIKNLINEVFGSIPKAEALEKNNKTENKNNSEMQSKVETNLEIETKKENNNEIENNNNSSLKKIDLLDSMSDDNFANDFGIDSTENNNKPKEIKEENINYQNLSLIEDPLFFVFNEIENNNYPLTSEKEEKIKENLFKEINKIFYYPTGKKYFIDIKNLLKIILMIENAKNYNENILNKEFDNFLNKRNDEKNYKILSEFLKSFKLFDEIIFTTNDKILISLNVDNFYILEKIKEKGIEIIPLKINQIKNL